MRQFLFLISLLLLSSISLAANDKSGVSPQVVSLPSGPGSIEGLGPAFEPQLNTGTASYSIALKVPDGIAGVQPSLKLSYNSGNANGPFGLGWSLTPPAITRQTEKGIPKYSNDDVFLYAGTELIHLIDGSYAPRTASSFMRFERIGDHWQAKDKSGKIYRFGLYPNDGNSIRQSRVIRHADTFDETYKWLLNETEDTLGNKIEFYYTTFTDSPGQVYLSEIRYNRQADGYQSVVFHYEQRADVFSNYTSGFLIQTARRVYKIQMLSRGQQVRHYELAYALADEDYPVPPSSAHLPLQFSRLSKVTQFDRTGTNALPPLRFEYTELYTQDADLYPFGNFPSAEDIDLNANGFIDSAGIQQMQNIPVALSFFNSNSEFLDVNGDGLPDIYNTQGGQHRYALNLGNNQFAPEQTMSGAPLIELASDQANLADLDGDGLSDFVYKTSDSQWSYYRNQGNGSFSAALIDTNPPAFNVVADDTRFTDINFDKKIDIIRTNTNGTLSYCLSQQGADTDHAPFGNFPGPEDVDENSDGQLNSIPWNCFGSQAASALNPDSLLQNSSYRLADMNGDRLQDMVWLRQVDDLAVIGYFPAKGLADFDDYVSLTSNINIGAFAIEDIKLTDVNADGLADLVKVQPGSVTVWFNLADHRFSDAVVYTNTVVYDPASTQTRFADLNGNGTPDLVWIQQGPATPDERVQYLDFSGRVKANQLHIIDNGIGRRTQINYQSSTEYLVSARDANNPWQQQAAFPLQMVAQTITFNGLDLDSVIGKDQYVTDFVYRDPYYDPYQKEFRGFSFVKKIERGDATAPTQLTRIWFHTGAPDNVDNDGDGTIDERGDKGETEELALKGSILNQEITTAAAGADSAANDGQLSSDNLVYQRLNNRWGIQRIHDIDGGTQRVATINEQEVSFAYHLEETLDLIELGNAPAKQLRKTYLSDAYGNAIEEKNYGDVDLSGDEIFSYQSYIYNIDLWIVDKVHTSTQTDALGTLVAETKYYYDGAAYTGLALGQVQQGLVSRVENWVEDGQTLNSKRSAYDQFGNPIGLKDGNGNLRTIEYDPDLQTYPISETIYLTNNTLTTYADYDRVLGTVIESTDYNGQTTIYQNDSFARPTAVVKPGDSVAYPSQTYQYTLADPHRGINYVYSASGLLDKTFSSNPYSYTQTRTREVVGQAGTVDSWEYVDGLGRKLGQVAEDEYGFILTGAQQFNARGSAYLTFQPLNITTPAFQRPSQFDPATETFYDASGRSISVTHPEDQHGVKYSSSISYQPLHITSIDENNNRKDTFNDGLERVIQVDEYNQGEIYTTRYEYDLLKNLTQVIDAQGNVKTMDYDGLGRKLSMQDPDKGQMLYDYDDASNLIQTTDNKNQVIDYTYDKANRPLTEDYTGQAGIEVTYHYDIASPDYPDATNLQGRVVRVDDLSGSSFVSYDARGNNRWSIKRLSGNDYRTSYTYDAMSRQTSMTWPDGESISYLYNNRGLLQSIPGFVDQVDYTETGQIAAMSLANNTRTQNAYDSRLRLIEKQTSLQSNTPFQHLQYDHDGVSNILSITDQRGLTDTDLKNATQNFVYDDLYRLSNASGVYGQISFAYNKIGNLIQKESPLSGQTGHVDDPLINLGVMNYGGTLGASNRVGKGNQPGPHAITATTSGLNYDYDANGNMISHAQGDSYSWDYRNRLSSVTKEGVTTNYTYDHADQRVSKKAAGASLADLYISKEYEIRQTTAYKYIMAAGQRVARIQSTVTTPTAESSQLISLQAGWNFVSLTVEPDQPQLADSLAVIQSLIETVYAFDAQEQQYKYYVPGDNRSTLTELRAHQGYLIKISSAAEWQVKGVPASSPVSLVEGWNLVGLPVEATTLPGFLPSIAGQYDAIWSYVAGNNSWQQFSTAAEVPPMLQTLTQLYGGKAYWIKMNSDATFYPPNDINGTTSFYHTDHLGSTNFVTDSAGVITQTTEYYPFGRPRVEETSDGQGSFYKYTGVELDKESGLAYHSARYYDNVVGRFVSVDPLFVETPGECGIQECNLYGYATNNPFSFIDPSGEASVSENIQDMANASAANGNKFGMHAWAVAGGAWAAFGFDSVSKTADHLINGRNDYSGGDGGWAAFEVATLGKGGAIVIGGKKLLDNIGGIANKVWKAGLNGGKNTVFWSGPGTKDFAQTIGNTIESTPIGRTMDFIHNNIKKLPNSWWNNASKTFAENATGIPRAVLNNPRATSTWNTVEKPILETNKTLTQIITHNPN